MALEATPGRIDNRKEHKEHKGVFCEGGQKPETIWSAAASTPL
jgi:hypothetical protein